MSPLKAAGVAVILALGAAALTPTDAAEAQPDDVTLVEGQWAGEILIGGSYLVQGESALGPYSDFVIPVTGSITMDFFVVEDGIVGGGTMDVDIDWARSGTSTAEDGSHTGNSGHQEEAQLSLAGSLVELIATGTVNDNRSVFGDGSPIPEVSGIRSSEVEWLFRASEFTCGLITGWMTSSTGAADFMSFVTVPEDAEDVEHNHLYAISRLWPVDRPEADTENLNERIDILNRLVNGVAADPEPKRQDVRDLVRELEELRSELADLPWCAIDELGIGQVGSGDSWLAEIFRVLMSRVLGDPSRYLTQDLVWFLNAAARAGALAGQGENELGLVGAFERALLEHLDAAIDRGDLDLVLQLAAAAERFALTDLFEAATAALPPP